MAGTSAGARKGWETRKRKVYVPEDKEHAKQRYAQAFYEYEIGVRWMRVATPAVLNEKEAGKVRAMVRQHIKRETPHLARKR